MVEKEGERGGKKVHPLLSNPLVQESSEGGKGDELLE
jgi:hypothetical protein